MRKSDQTATALWLVGGLAAATVLAVGLALAVVQKSNSTPTRKLAATSTAAKPSTSKPAAVREGAGEGAEGAAMGFALIFIIAGLGCLSLALYFLPSGIAVYLNHNNALAIFFLNLLLGWSVAGWVVALVWAFAKEPRRDYYPSYPPPHYR